MILLMYLCLDSIPLKAKCKKYIAVVIGSFLHIAEVDFMEVQRFVSSGRFAPAFH